VNIEILFTRTDPDLVELRQRTERSLADLAPYANITLARINAQKTPTRPVPQNLPALLIDNTIVPADSAQSPATTGTTTDARTDTRTDTGTTTNTKTVGRSGAGMASSEEASRDKRSIPSEQRITAHLARALLSAGPGAIRLPLVHRRIIAIALLLMLAGALTSAFLSVGPMLTFTGLLVLPVGLATNGTRSRRQPLMLIAVVAALASGAFLLTYFAPLLLSQNGAATPPSSGFFYAAVACLGVAWIAALAALLTRRRLRQTLRNRLLLEVTDTSRTPSIR
jgi:hypothetical protein